MNKTPYPQTNHTTRLLTHRIRGFGSAENTLHNLNAAIDGGVRIVEIDTRHTADSEIVVHHPPCLETLTTGNGFIHDLSLDQVIQAEYRNSNHEKIASHEEYLAIAKQCADLVIWIDIKGFGLEEKYIELIRKYSLEDRAWLISWAYQTILRIHQLAPEIKIGLSYACTANRVMIQPMIKKIAQWVGKQSKPLFKRRRKGRWADFYNLFLNIYPLEEFQYTIPAHYALGYNYMNMIPGLPPYPILDALINAKGAVGMFPSQATPPLIVEAHSLGLIVYVFSIDGPDRLKTYLQKSKVDIVFTNNSDLIKNTPVIHHR